MDVRADAVAQLAGWVWHFDFDAERAGRGFGALTNETDMALYSLAGDELGRCWLTRDDLADIVFGNLRQR